MKPTESFKSLADWLPWLESLSPREIVLGLDRVQAVLQNLDIARPETVITVAGTNGKGSSIAMLEAILRQQGIRTGSFTSPHVHRYNERTRIDGQPASDEAIISALATVESARGDTPLTFFEFGTLATLVAFAAAGVDAWLLEVGMGGRLDAVNAIEPDGCLITNVALDHCAWLGDDVESIAAEKAGIMRAGKPVVFGSTSLPDAIVRIAAETGADLVLAGRDFGFSVNTNRSWTWRGQRFVIENIAPPKLQGDVQFENAANVLALLEALERDDLLVAQDISAALAGIRLDGRFQRRGDRWVLDVAHNPAAAEVLAGQLESLERQGQVIAIVGMLADKDVPAFVAPLNRVVDRFIAVSIDAARGTGAQALAVKIANSANKPCQVIEDLPDALAAACAIAAEDDLLLVTGSFYIVGPALQWIDRNGSTTCATELSR